MQCSIPSEVARAINLHACAHYPNAPRDGQRYGVEGHQMRGIFILQCSPCVVEYIVRDIGELVAKSQEPGFRDQCVAAIGALRTAALKDAQPPAPARPLTPDITQTWMDRRPPR